MVLVSEWQTTEAVGEHLEEQWVSFACPCNPAKPSRVFVAGNDEPQVCLQCGRAWRLMVDLQSATVDKVGLEHLRAAAAANRAKMQAMGWERNEDEVWGLCS